MNRNITNALFNTLENILKNGTRVGSRDQEQMEILSTLTKINHPSERFLVLPYRNNNVFAQIAETLWVLAGRNDLAFLTNYLPRAEDFSDDKITWRAAYGPRLRNWKGKIDQLQEVVNRFKEDPLTKRAVMNIFDPESDYQDTKDVPCNNWLHFIQRNGSVDLHVTVRANDAIWGFSGINFFEWSVLHEIIANSLGWKVGKLSWYVGTFHVYSRHYSTAEKICKIANLKSMYEFNIKPTPVVVGVDKLDEILNLVFKAEKFSKMGEFNKSSEIERGINDPFFKNASVILKIHNALNLNVDSNIVTNYLRELGETDFHIAAIEYLSRRWKSHKTLELINEISPDFLKAYKLMRNTETSSLTT